MTSQPSDKSQSGEESSSWTSWFYNFQDTQRLERLQHCRKLDGILKSCRSASRDPKSVAASDAKSDDDSNVEGCSQGLRMMKYFGWRGILLDDDKDDNTTSGDKTNNPAAPSSVSSDRKEEIRQRIQTTCAREEHAVWACRAVSLGCGKELASLKTCFDQEGPFPVLTAPVTGYEWKQPSDESAKNTNKKLILPCHELQSQLGDCVNKSARELAKRRKKQAKKG